MIREAGAFAQHPRYDCISWGICLALHPVIREARAFARTARRDLRNGGPFQAPKLIREAGAYSRPPRHAQSNRRLALSPQA